MTVRTTLDRGTGIAIWRQIMEWMKAEIASGAYEKGSRLPPESEIAARFGVNRHTVRRAISALTAEGVLRADQGRGTFVAAASLSYPITSRTRFSEIVSGQNKAPSGRLTGSAIEDADALLASWMGVAVGTALVRLEILRVADGVPMMVATSWFEHSRFPNLVNDYAETGSITEAMAKAGVDDYRRTESRVTAELVETPDAATLGIAAGQPVLVVESLNVDPADKPLQYTRTRMAAERIQLVIES